MSTWALCIFRLIWVWSFYFASVFFHVFALSFLLLLYFFLYEFRNWFWHFDDIYFWIRFVYLEYMPPQFVLRLMRSLFWEFVRQIWKMPGEKQAKKKNLLKTDNIEMLIFEFFSSFLFFLERRFFNVLENCWHLIYLKSIAIADDRANSETFIWFRLHDWRSLCHRIWASIWMRLKLNIVEEIYMNKRKRFRCLHDVNIDCIH